MSAICSEHKTLHRQIGVLFCNQ